MLFGVTKPARERRRTDDRRRRSVAYSAFIAFNLLEIPEVRAGVFLGFGFTSH